jgi:hypothetical protein
MRFEILGEIADIETFAAGAGIREIGRLRKVYGPGAGVSARALAACGSWMAQSIWLKYTGTKPPESGGRNTRSNTCFEIRNHGKDTNETTGRVHR